MSAVVPRSDAVYDGATVNGTTQILYASVSAAGSGNNTLIAASAGKKIRVLGGLLVAAGPVTAQFEDGAGGTGLTGAMSMATGTPIPLPPTPNGHFQTSTGNLLNLSLGGAVQVSGWLIYVLC